MERQELIEKAVQDLMEGKVIGWAEGRSEIGPRALGHRSILADPRPDDMSDRVNDIKHRERWRPFAPMVLRTHWKEWFDGLNEGKEPLKWMLTNLNSKFPEKVPAITHVDGTSRVQLVDPEDGIFHDVLKLFGEKTGVPILLNTSFNDAGQPIVDTAEDAMEAFLSMDLDVLYLDGKYRITKI